MCHRNLPHAATPNYSHPKKAREEIVMYSSTTNTLFSLTLSLGLCDNSPPQSWTRGCREYLPRAAMPNYSQSRKVREDIVIYSITTNTSFGLTLSLRLCYIYLTTANCKAELEVVVEICSMLQCLTILNLERYEK